MDLQTPTHAPRAVTRLIHWIGIAAALLGALTALLVALGKFGEAAYATCNPFPSIPWCVDLAPPKLAAYDSPEVDGGHTQAEYCEPVAVKYRSQFPDFDIQWQASEGSHKDLLGHVTYTYHCEFSAVPKARHLAYWLMGAGLLCAIGLVLYWRRARRPRLRAT